MITVEGVSQTFRSGKGVVEALADLNLTVHDGECVAVIGRSGCGKSTLLRLIAGLLRPTSGTVAVDGEPVARPRADVAMMFQRPALLPWRSVLTNVMLPLEISKERTEEGRRRARDLLELAGLGGFENRLPHELSGGMQQRVALCRALVTEPRVLLMDEPFSALDSLTRIELGEELQRVHMSRKTTIVLVTHSIEEAVLLADRVVVLSSRPGRVRDVVEVKIPRPRELGPSAHLTEVAEASAQLHGLLMNPTPARSAS
ncbi:ABC transporter ATP-binding protein [Hamadaea sp. NPDC050747]|uniref:ABC transporter ATP-binding protein n=1 Tax=Hamadaea sp. NPDC050747 TaxID=3155789 RepID=UPI0033E4560C